jgi:hypothetical protein
MFPLRDLETMSDTIRVTIAQLSGHVTAYLSCSTDRDSPSNRPNMTHHYWILKADDGPTLDIPYLAVADKGCFGASNVEVHYLWLTGWVYVLYVGHIDKIMKPISIL